MISGQFSENDRIRLNSYSKNFELVASSIPSDIMFISVLHMSA